MMDEAKRPNKAIIVSIIVVLLITATAVTVVLSKKDDAQTKSDQTNQTNQMATTNSTQTTAVSDTYKDGTYTATGNYRTPGGQESIGVKVTITNNTISDATVTQNAASGEAEEYQSAFVSGYKTQVVGKKVNDVSLSRVAGSSLTPLGFNTALQTIKTQASA